MIQTISPVTASPTIMHQNNAIAVKSVGAATATLASALDALTVITAFMSGKIMLVARYSAGIESNAVAMKPL